eukprot:TRINITY_DN7523_c0_g2_i2.p1 TRINITY_DN7523_c0_g2~~TRINITY_DN7523_c0_g2_i2.p1  ORF type:complete len:167 (+),score=37.72 TRINITY_DN7523_c0_g2_i2:98-598(+)
MLGLLRRSAFQAATAHAPICQRPILLPLSTRFFSSRELVGIHDVRKGMLLCVDGKYWEVKEWAQSKQGRGAASYNVTYDELETGKERVHKFNSSAKLSRVEPDKFPCQVMYMTGTGKEEKMVVLADEDFNEVELPYSMFTSNPTLAEGTKVLLYKDDGTVFKVSVR